jgi:general secretion pathway protein H
MANARPKLTTPARNSAGFTLLELTIVIAILAVLMGLVIPKLRDTGATELRSQAHRLAMTFKLVRSEAILQGIPLQINFDLDEQRYWVTSADPIGGEDVAATTLGRLARGFHFNREVGISDVMLPAAGAKVNQGRIYTIFYPDGTVDPTVIHLASASQAYTLHLNPMSSRLDMTAGYVVPRYEGLQ